MFSHGSSKFVAPFLQCSPRQQTCQEQEGGPALAAVDTSRLAANDARVEAAQSVAVEATSQVGKTNLLVKFDSSIFAYFYTTWFQFFTFELFPFEEKHALFVCSPIGRLLDRRRSSQSMSTLCCQSVPRSGRWSRIFRETILMILQPKSFWTEDLISNNLQCLLTRQISPILFCSKPSPPESSTSGQLASWTWIWTPWMPSTTSCRTMWRKAKGISIARSHSTAWGLPWSMQH